MATPVAPSASQAQALSGAASVSLRASDASVTKWRRSMPWRGFSGRGDAEECGSQRDGLTCRTSGKRGSCSRSEASVATPNGAACRSRGSAGQLVIDFFGRSGSWCACWRSALAPETSSANAFPRTWDAAPHHACTCVLNLAADACAFPKWKESVTRCVRTRSVGRRCAVH